MQDGAEFLEFVYTHLFDATASGWVTDEALARLEKDLLANPLAGVVVPGLGGVRKIRMRTTGGGKRGGARVFYLHRPAKQRIYFLFVFPKNRQVRLTPTERRRILAMVRTLK